MKIAGFIKNSFLDYPAQISSVIFTAGCNYHCHYCHNSQLINFKCENPVCESEIFEFLQSRKGMIDAVVISGGEPTCHKDLPELICKIKDMDFLIKLDTNGTNFEMLKQLIENKQIDYVAMDIKAPLNKYEMIVGKDADENVEKSINLLINSKIKYEFRTTFSNKLNKEDLIEIAKCVKGAKVIYFQKCNLKNAEQYANDFEKDMDEIKSEVEKYVNKCIFRGF